jgi:hypothetical protein
MRKHSICLPIVISLALAAMGCGDDGGGGGGAGNTPGSGASGGSGATGGTPSGDVCTFVCSSRCLGELGGLPAESIPDCINACQMVGLYEDCEAEVTAFIVCLEANDCGSSGGTACLDEALDFSRCFAPF